MSVERTLAIIKPDAVAKNLTGTILAHLEEKGFVIRAMRMQRLDEDAARAFYSVHSERPFYMDLVRFMTSGRCVPLVLERENAVAGLREVIGATNPSDAEEGTIRQLYAESVERNAIHASDSTENAVREIDFFFS